jgi:hypothetical protein
MQYKFRMSDGSSYTVDETVVDELIKSRNAAPPHVLLQAMNESGGGCQILLGQTVSITALHGT